MQKKTHNLVAEPKVSVGRLADYMASSEQARRSILRSCKYQPIARVTQYNEAKTILSEFLLSENRDTATVHDKLERLRARIPNDEFEAKVIELNCDCVEHALSHFAGITFPKAQVFVTRKLVPLELAGTKVSVAPQLMLMRTTKTNEIRIGAAMIRYQKGKQLSDDAARHQAAFLHGYFGRKPFEEQAKPEKGLCVVIDAQSGSRHEAPGNAVYLFKEMEAACAAIAERWPAIAPPSDAVV